MLRVLRRYAWSVEKRPRAVAAPKTHRAGGVQTFCIGPTIDPDATVRQGWNARFRTAWDADSGTNGHFVPAVRRPVPLRVPFVPNSVRGQNDQRGVVLKLPAGERRDRF